MGDAGEIVAVEKHAGRADALRRPPSGWARRSSRCAPQDARSARARPSTASSSTRRARTSARSPRGRTRAGARPAARRRWPALQREILDAGAAASRPAVPSSTRPARSRQRRTSCRGSFLAAHGHFRPTHHRRPPCLGPSGHAPHAHPSAPRPHRRLLRREVPPRAEQAGGTRPTLPVLPRAVAAADHEPARPRYRCVNCLQRFELCSVCPNCGEHSTIVRMSNTALYVCGHCQSSMLTPI